MFSGQKLVDDVSTPALIFLCNNPVLLESQCPLGRSISVQLLLIDSLIAFKAIWGLYSVIYYLLGVCHSMC